MAIYNYETEIESDFMLRMNGPKMHSVILTFMRWMNTAVDDEDPNVREITEAVRDEFLSILEQYNLDPYEM